MGAEADEDVLEVIEPPAPPDLPLVAADAADDLVAGADFAGVDGVAAVDEALTTGFTLTVLLAAVLRRRGVEEGVAVCLRVDLNQDFLLQVCE